MTVQTLAIVVLLVSFFVMIFLRFPIAYAVGLSSVFCMLVQGQALTDVCRLMVKGISSFSLMAVPFFITMGVLMGSGGISEKLIALADACVGWMRGGMAMVNIVASYFFGGISGSASADTASIGSIMIPMMVNQGYDADFSTAVTITSSCEGLLVPPSHNMVIYATTAGGISVGSLFLAGYLPGALLAMVLMIGSYIISVKENYPKGSQFEHIGWLAGNSYNIYQVSIPCSFDGDRDHVVGDFLLCLFENHCDPIVGGREGLGYTKIFCNIPNFKKLNGVWTVPTSSWDFTFSKLTVDTNKKAKDEARFLEILNRSQGKMNFKYVPGTGKAEPDAAYPVFNPKWKKPDDYQFPMMETKIVNCDGNIEWFRPNWEDMPTYAHLAQYMASAPVKSIIGAQLKYYSDACDFSHSIQLK